MENESEIMSTTINLRTRYYRLYPSDGYLGYAHEDYQAEVHRSAFLVIDVYGLGFHPDDPQPAYRQDGHDEQARPALAWLGSAEHEDRIVKASLLPALEAARDIGMTVVYLNNSAPKIGLRFSEFGKVLQRQLNTDMERMFAEDNVDPKEYHFGDSDHVKISKLLQPRENDYFIRKHVYSGFVGTRDQEPVRGGLFSRCLSDDDGHRRPVAQLQGHPPPGLHPGQRLSRGTGRIAGHPTHGQDVGIAVLCEHYLTGIHPNYTSLRRKPV
jgi:nicotinamidase-related amidase